MTIVRSIGSGGGSSSSGALSTSDPLEGAPLYIYGHSYNDDSYNSGSGAAGAWSSRLGARRLMTVTKRHLIGLRMISAGDCAVRRVLAGSTAWTPGARGLITLCCTYNDVTAGGSTAQYLRSYGHALRTFLVATRAKAKVAASSAQWVLSAGWTADSTSSALGGIRWQTTTAGSYAETAFVGTAVDLLVTLRAAANGAYSVTVDGTPVAATAVANLDQTVGVDYTPAVVPITGLSAGTHTLRVTLTSGSWLGVDGIFIPSESPPPVLLLAEGPVTVSPSNSAAMAANYLPLMQSISGEFPHALYVPAGSGWDPATMLREDGLHPNDRGASYLASTALNALGTAVSWRNGLNLIGAATSYALPPAPATPSGGQDGTGNTGVVTGVTGLRAWYRADLLGSASDGDLINALADSGPGGRNLASDGGSSRPMFKAAQINGKPALRFDGSNDFLNSPATAGSQILPATDFTVFVVLKPSGTGQRTIIGPESGTGAPQVVVDSTGKLQLVKANTAVVGTATTVLSTSSFSIVALTFTSGSAWAAYLNGAADGGSSTAQTMANNAVAHLLGRRSTTEPFSGDIAEVIVYDGVLSSTDRATVTAYLGSRYGITVT